jgi:hypothetical protein
MLRRWPGGLGSMACWSACWDPVARLVTHYDVDDAGIDHAITVLDRVFAG